MVKEATKQVVRAGYTPPKVDTQPRYSIEELQGRAGYSLDEFAYIFGKSRTWAYRRMYAGDIRVIRGMGAIIVPATEVERLQGEAGVAERRTRRKSKGGSK